MEADKTTGKSKKEMYLDWRDAWGKWKNQKEIVGRISLEIIALEKNDKIVISREIEVWKSKEVIWENDRLLWASIDLNRIAEGVASDYIQSLRERERVDEIGNQEREIRKEYDSMENGIRKEVTRAK